MHKSGPASLRRIGQPRIRVGPLQGRFELVSMAGFILDHRQHAVSSTSANLLIAGKIIRWGHRPGECLSGAQRTRGHRLFVGPRSVNRNDGVNQYLGRWTWFGWRHVATVWTRTERTLSFVQEPPSLPGCPDSGSSRPDCVRGTTRRTYAGSDSDKTPPYPRAKALSLLVVGIVNTLSSILYGLAAKPGFYQ